MSIIDIIIYIFFTLATLFVGIVLLKISEMFIEIRDNNRKILELLKNEKLDKTSIAELTYVDVFGKKHKVIR